MSLMDYVREGIGNILIGALEGVEKAVLAPIDTAIKICETLEEITEDPVLEGKKAGYERAAKEYQPVIQSLKTNYKNAIVKFEAENETTTKQIYEAKAELKQIEEKKRLLWAKVMRYGNNASVAEPEHVYTGYSVASFSRMATGLSSNRYDMLDTISAGNGQSLTDVLLSGKRKKKAQAEAEGYQQAKEEHEAKIAELKKTFDDFVERSDINIKSKLRLLAKYYEEIAIVELAIAELELYGVR